MMEARDAKYAMIFVYHLMVARTNDLDFFTFSTEIEDSKKDNQTYLLMITTLTRMAPRQKF